MSMEVLIDLGPQAISPTPPGGIETSKEKNHFFHSDEKTKAEDHGAEPLNLATTTAPTETHPLTGTAHT